MQRHAPGQRRSQDASVQNLIPFPQSGSQPHPGNQTWASEWRPLTPGPLNCLSLTVWTGDDDVPVNSGLWHVAIHKDTYKRLGMPSHADSPGAECRWTVSLSTSYLARDLKTKPAHGLAWICSLLYQTMGVFFYLLSFVVKVYYGHGAYSVF